MAPEVLREERYSEKADIWSFGVVAWEVASQKAPFPHVSPLRVISMVGHQGTTLDIPMNIPRTLSELILSCWRDPHLRPPFDKILQTLSAIKIAEIAQKNV
eukprot:TRINITY_DN6772_c0_g1_i6.p1 TRINITY_DN6772_c0_g1~~TRINITY_DN6772_c0_g1_i6.p1  ORF type:complete len:101 (-),score=23.01 TRINITY_DN6772_c0_g1_i6:44-346(-)